MGSDLILWWERPESDCNMRYDVPVHPFKTSMNSVGPHIINVLPRAVKKHRSFYFMFWDFVILIFPKTVS